MNPNPIVITTGKHLLMRYKAGGSFSYNNIKMNSTDQAMFELAGAFSSIQDQQPTGVYSVVTKSIIL